MLFTDHQQNLDVCAQVFPNLAWVIESDSVNGAIYKGNSQRGLTVEIYASTEGFSESLIWDDTFPLMSAIRPSLSLLEALQTLKAEWQRLDEVMS